MKMKSTSTEDFWQLKQVFKRTCQTKGPMAAMQKSSSFPHNHTFPSENRKVRVQLFQITCDDLSKCNRSASSRSDDEWFKQCRRSRAQHPDKTIPCSKTSPVALLLQLIGLTCCLLFWGCKTGFLWASWQVGLGGRVSPMACWIWCHITTSVCHQHHQKMWDYEVHMSFIGRPLLITV